MKAHKVNRLGLEYKVVIRFDTTAGQPMTIIH